jgi:hypothetical protein
MNRETSHLKYGNEITIGKDVEKVMTKYSGTTRDDLAT